jgi:hypothetical protein
MDHHGRSIDSAHVAERNCATQKNCAKQVTADVSSLFRHREKLLQPVDIAVGIPIILFSRATTVPT